MSLLAVPHSVQRTRNAMALGALLNLFLIIYGLLRFPQTLTASADGPKGLIADIFILSLYALIGILGARRTHQASPAALRTGRSFGLAVAIVYALVVIGEYVPRFNDHSPVKLSVVMVSLIFSLYLLAGARGGYVTGRTRFGVVAAVWSA